MNGFDYDEEKKRYADLAKDFRDSTEQFYQSLRNDMAHDEWARNSYMDSLLGELSRDLDLGSLPNSCRAEEATDRKPQAETAPPAASPKNEESPTKADEERPSMPPETPVSVPPEAVSGDFHEAPPVTEVEMTAGDFPGLKNGLTKGSILNDAGENLEWLENWFKCHGTDEIPFAWKNLSDGRIVVDDGEMTRNDIWYIGDLHGDILAAETAIRFILGRNPDARIVFLGDLIDRQPYALNVFALVLKTAVKHPGQILWLEGNHDAGLSWKEEDGTGKFASAWDPHECADWLNLPENGKYCDLGKKFIEIAKDLPCALFLRGGLFVAHGGIPCKDILTTLDPQGVTVDTFREERFLRSYYINRIAHKRRSIAHDEVGYEQTEMFSQLADAALGFPVRGILRGHTHPCKIQRFEFYSKGVARDRDKDIIPVLTFVSLSAWLPDERINPPFETDLLVAHHRNHAMPELVKLKLPAGLVESFWYREPEGEPKDATVS